MTARDIPLTDPAELGLDADRLLRIDRHLESSSYPIRSQLRQLVGQAIVD